MANTSTETSGNRKTSTDTNKDVLSFPLIMYPLLSPMLPSAKAYVIENGSKNHVFKYFTDAVTLGHLSALMSISECYRSIHKRRWQSTGIQTKAFLWLSKHMKHALLYELTAFIKDTKLKWKRPLLAKWNEHVYWLKIIWKDCLI